jgi:hypothetical protein
MPYILNINYDLVRSVDATPIPFEIGRKMFYGHPLSTDEAAGWDRRWSDETQDRLYDLTVSSKGLIVSGGIKDAIERLEPNNHQFFEIECFDVNNVKYPERFFYVNVLTRKETVLIEKSNVHYEKIDPPKLYDADGRYWSYSLGLSIVDDETTFDRRLVGSSHLWMGSYPTIGETFVSDALAAEFRKFNVENINFVRCKLA